MSITTKHQSDPKLRHDQVRARPFTVDHPVNHYLNRALSRTYSLMIRKGPLEEEPLRRSVQSIAKSLVPLPIGGLVPAQLTLAIHHGVSV